ncbi:pentatricopeptide repeat-containing protein [Populus alba x Populus x berolinensis]|nr:pentatricopeptide repeat-containing protein [Populus alba x Populus x berolinensis]
MGLYHQSGLYDDVLQLFEEMRNSNLKPGEKSALVTMYASCGCLDIAEELFTRISSKNLVVLTAMVSGYSRVGRVEDARFVCYHMYEKDLVFSRLGYAESDKPQEALNLFSQMQVLGIKPDQVTILSVISASSSWYSRSLSGLMSEGKGSCIRIVKNLKCL